MKAKQEQTLADLEVEQMRLKVELLHQQVKAGAMADAYVDAEPKLGKEFLETFRWWHYDAAAILAGRHDGRIALRVFLGDTGLWEVQLLTANARALPDRYISRDYAMRAAEAWIKRAIEAPPLKPVPADVFTNIGRKISTKKGRGK